MKSTKVVAITSWMKPGAVISSVRMQPPMRSLRSSTSTFCALAGEHRRADQRVDAAADDDVIGIAHRSMPPALPGWGGRGEAWTPVARMSLAAGALLLRHQRHRADRAAGALDRSSAARRSGSRPWAAACRGCKGWPDRSGWPCASGCAPGMAAPCRRPRRHRCRCTAVPQPIAPRSMMYSMQSTVGPGECGPLASALRNLSSELLRLSQSVRMTTHSPRIDRAVLGFPGLDAVGRQQEVVVGGGFGRAVDDVDRRDEVLDVGIVSV